MALEEKEKGTIIDTILEAEEEVTITPPARRKKAERMKSKSTLPAIEDETNHLNGKNINLNNGSALAAASLDRNGESELTKHGLLSQVDAINSSESRETVNGMSDVSISAEVKDDNCSFGNTVENSSVEAKLLPGLANEANPEFSSKENEEVTTTWNVLSDIKEDPKVGVESCISPDITCGSQDEESFFSAEEAETVSEYISSSLPNVEEVVNETATESENNEDRSTIKSENTNTKQETLSNLYLAEDDQAFSGGQVSELSECGNEPLPKPIEGLDKSCENNHIVPENRDKDSQSTETTVVDSSITNSSDGSASETVKIDSTVSDLLAETEVGAVGGVLETDTDVDSEEEWSSSSNTSSEGEYDVGYFELNCGLKEQNVEVDSTNGLNEILSAFPSGTELVSVTTDSEDDSNKGETPRGNFKSTEQLESSLFDGDESDAGLKMLACFSPKSECPVVMDYTSTDQEESVTDLPVDSDHVDNNNTTSLTKVASSAGEVYEDPDVSDNDTVAQFDVGDTAVEESVESTFSEIPPSDVGNVIVKRTGSFRLVKNNGLLKIVDTSETPVTSEDVKKANILKTQSLEVAENGSYDRPGCDSEEAKEALQNAVSESKALKEEFKSVCDNIAALERMSTDNAEIETNGVDLGEDSVDSGGIIINVDSMSFSEQKPTLKVTGVTTNDSATDDVEVSTGENDGEGRSSDSAKKHRPKRLPVGKRYSLDTGTALLSPEDDIYAELKNFTNNGSFKVQAPVSTNGQISTEEVMTDGGQEEDAAASPAPPPRGIAGHGQRLNYSGSFSPGASRVVNFRTKEGNRPITKRAQSERRERRSKTLPNNVFDMLGSAFKTSSSTPEQMLQGPITLITDNMPATFPGFPINRRAQVALELYTTERSYVRRLETILQLFKKPCEENKLLDKKEIHTMFLNIQDIFVVNKDLLFLLQERISHWHDQQCVGDIFIDQSSKIIERMKIYAKYCNNYDSAEKLYKEKIRKREFETFVNNCYEHRVCQPGLNLPAYLISVVQRIPRYLLLLQDLLKRTPENHPDHGNLSKALTKMEHLAVFINNQLQTAVGIKAMEQLRLRVEGLKALEGRALIKEAEVVVNGSKKTRQALLLNDMLVFAAKGVTRTSEVEKTLELGTLWCMDLEGNNPQSVKEDSLEIYTPEHSYIMYAGTKNEKKVWLQKLRTAVAMALHGEEANENYEIESRKATFTYKDGRNYCGNFVSGKRNGQGTLSWPNQAKYQGEWEDDDRCGWGELFYNSGDKYRGEWLDDKQHGIGTMEYMNGDVYHGQWYQGDMHGKGAIDFKNGDRFEGEFHHNEIHGPSGELRCVSGLMYRGEWRHSKKHGKGRMHFPNGDIYNGEFANDRLSGQGEMQYADGSVYKGQWMDNQRGGHGEFSSPDGTHYIGGWSKDHINGKGCMEYSNGDSYDGNWFKNTRFGQGVMRYSNGDIYEGMFEYDLCSKVGKMTYKDGSVYDGSWSNGLRHGKGKMLYANKNSVYEGDWFFGMRHGEGVQTYANRASYNGHWELDKQHGRGMYTDPSTFYHYEGEWKNGLKHGKGVEETKEGKYEGEWKDNMRHGQGTEILSCETVYEGRWKENKKHGPGVKRLKSGMVEEQNWLEGKQVDVTSIDVIELPLIQRR